MAILRVGSVGIADTGSGGATSLTLSGYTVPVGASLMVIDVLSAPTLQTTNTPTWNGSSAGMVFVGIITQGTSTRIERWYLISPTATTANVVVTKSASSRYGVRVRCYSGTDLTTPMRVVATRNALATSPSNLAATSQAGDLVIDAFNARVATPGSLAVGGGQTNDWSGTISATVSEGGVSEKPGEAGTTTMTWTYAGGTLEVTHLANALIPAAGGGGGGLPHVAVLNALL